MDDSELLNRVHECVGHECDFFGRCSLQGKVLKYPGVMAGINPVTPDRSLFNGVYYQEADALRRHYDDIASAYRASGVRAWTVWVRVGDTDTPEFLQQRGHQFDYDPVAMACSMKDLRMPEPDGLDWEETNKLDVIGKVADTAFEFPPPAFEAALDRLPDQGWHAYLARVDGNVATTMLTYHSQSGDCGIACVSTLKEYRGRQLATRLMSAALREAKKAGMTSTSLQASPLGAGVYAKLGYRDLGRMPMWEWRDSSSSDVRR